MIRYAGRRPVDREVRCHCWLSREVQAGTSRALSCGLTSKVTGADETFARSSDAGRRPVDRRVRAHVPCAALQANPPREQTAGT